MHDPETVKIDVQPDTPTPVETIVPYGWGSVDLVESDPDTPWEIGGEG